MTTAYPPSAPPAMPRWHWRAWDAQARARPGAAWDAAHAWLATLPDLPAGALPMHRDPRGRPRFAAGVAADAGWSHSGDGLLVAFMRGAVLGVDMEAERPRPKALDVARRHFAPSELEWLEAQSRDDAGDVAFLRLWCAKEAVLKAHGHGLSFGLDRVVFAERAGTLVLAAADAALGDPAAWWLHEFAPHPGYRAALAWRAPGAA